MKKSICLILIFMLLLSLLVGCGQAEPDARFDNDVVEDTTTAEKGEETADATDDTAELETVLSEDFTDSNLEENTVSYYSGNGYTIREEAYSSYTLADPYNDVLLPPFTENLSADILPIYTNRTDCSMDELQENYERYASLVETRSQYTESRTGKEDNVYQISWPVPASGEEYTGQLKDFIFGSAVVIRSMNNAITIGYTLPGSSKKCTNHDYILELTQTDPFVKAACEYAGITNPEILYNHQYTTNEDFPQWGEYKLFDKGSTPEISAENLLFHSVSITLGGTDSISIIIKTLNTLNVGETYPIRNYDDAVIDFCEKYGLEQEDILQSGFCYIAESMDTFIPCYLLLVPNEEPLPEYFDPEMYGNYDLIALPAIVRS